MTAFPATLVPVATRVRTLGFRMVKIMTHFTGEVMRQRDFKHHSEAAVWEAFLDLGGDPDNIAAFDLNTRLEELVKRSLKVLRQELVGRRSCFGDAALRVHNRKNRAMVDRYQWSAWRYNAENETQGRGERKGQQPGDHSLMSEYIDSAEQEERLYERELMGVEELLRDKLNEREFKWLVQRFCHNVPQDTMIRELMAADPKYQGEDGYTKAENVINVTVFRAKQKAAKALGPIWKAATQDVAAA